MESPFSDRPKNVQVWNIYPYITGSWVNVAKYTIIIYNGYNISMFMGTWMMNYEIGSQNLR